MKTLHLLFSALLLAGVTVAPSTVYAGDHEKKDTHDGTQGDHKDDKGKKGEHDDHDKGHGKGEKHSGIHSQDEMRASMGEDGMGSSQNRQRGDQITEELNRQNLQRGGGMNQQQQQMNQGSR